MLRRYFVMDKRSGINFSGILIGVLVSYIITLLFFIIYALLLTFTSVSEMALPKFTIFVTITGVVLAGALSARNTASKGWLNGGIAGILYIAVMALLGTFLVKEFGPSSSLAVKFLWGAFLGSLGGMIGINL
ncbi:TIGR04086 family membrane protein [Caldanaerobacter subterraneus]|uniref:Membrane protein n=1 Tax=Caldanaerobacter subterraneus subsp. yonseiensis KB-1 TaxID=1388761 RepID=U5CGY4_CALSX|nr:TIGR04086 family membrane protein [Caldanaerobacter subterraneus]ERM92195.1 membrane protein [Caldanaerobacter subterraneus subsp. yonseiensis KB-1]